MTTPYVIQGRAVSIPVEIRSARSWFATFAVPFAAVAPGVPAVAVPVGAPAGPGSEG